MLVSPLGPRGYSESFLATGSQFKADETSHCPDSGSLLLKHGSQAIPSLTTPARATVLSSYTDDVFD